MALKDSFINLNKALRTTLQNVPAVVDTLIRGFDGVAEAAEKAAEEQITYSTSEHIVGKWTDGSEIYAKTIDCGALPNNSVKTITHEIANISKIIKIEGVTIGGGGWTLQMGTSAPGETIQIIQVYANNTDLRINTSNIGSGFNETYVTLYYIKSTASRIPEENDTRNGGDEEPDVKTVEEPVEELKK